MDSSTNTTDKLRERICAPYGEIRHYFTPDGLEHVRFASRLLGTGVARSDALELLVIAGFVRGLSVRDVEASLANALGAGGPVEVDRVSRVPGHR